MHKCSRHYFYTFIFLTAAALIFFPMHSMAQRYNPRLTLGGYLYSNLPNAGELDGLFPLFQSDDSVFFADARGLDFENTPYEYNLGLGIRHMNAEQTYLFGLYGFYDRRKTANGHFFSQVTPGVELRTERWQFWTNGYIPIGQTTKKLRNMTSVSIVNGSAGLKIYDMGLVVKRFYQGLMRLQDMICLNTGPCY